MKNTIIERTYKLIVWEKETMQLAWTEIFKTNKTERDIEKMIEGEKLNMNRYTYRLDEM